MPFLLATAASSNPFAIDGCVHPFDVIMYLLCDEKRCGLITDMSNLL